MASCKSISRRRDLALTEIGALAVNLIHDVRSLEARLERGGLGLAVLAYPELRIIETAAECIRHELIEARAETPRRPWLTRWITALAVVSGRLRGRSSSTQPAA